jgi:hypothetical protein
MATKVAEYNMITNKHPSAVGFKPLTSRNSTYCPINYNNNANNSIDRKERTNEINSIPVKCLFRILYDLYLCFFKIQYARLFVLPINLLTAA